MSEPQISDEVGRSLCEKLKNADLTPEERELLNAILRIVWDVTGPQASPDLEFDLNGCFEEGQAAVILEYQTTVAEERITKSIRDASVTRGRLPRAIDQGKPTPP